MKRDYWQELYKLKHCTPQDYLSVEVYGEALKELEKDIAKAKTGQAPELPKRKTEKDLVS